MDRECSSSAARYGIVLDASLITGIDPPPEVESALAAINTAHNQVSSDISLAQASADQKIVQSRRAVEIETLKAQAEVEPLTALASQLVRAQGNGRRRAARLRAQRAARSVRQAQQVVTGGEAMMDLAHRHFRHVSWPASFLCRCFSALLRLLGIYTIVEEAPLPRLRAVRQGRGHHRRAGPALPAVQARPEGADRELARERLYVLDMRLDQEYLRSQPVNSEEGAPMGIGIWYEMFISDPGRLSVQERRSARLAGAPTSATPPCAA